MVPSANSLSRILEVKRGDFILERKRTLMPDNKLELLRSIHSESAKLRLLLVNIDVAWTGELSVSLSWSLREITERANLLLMRKLIKE